MIVRSSIHTQNVCGGCTTRIGMGSLSQGDEVQKTQVHDMNDDESRFSTLVWCVRASYKKKNLKSVLPHCPISSVG